MTPRIALKLLWTLALVTALVVAAQPTADFVYRAF